MVATYNQIGAVYNDFDMTYNGDVLDKGRWTWGMHRDGSDEPGEVTLLVGYNYGTSTGPGDDITVTLPTGTEVGDLVLALYKNTSNLQSAALSPTGYTSMTNVGTSNGRTQSFWKIMESSDISTGSVLFALPTLEEGVGFLVTMRGDGSDPLNTNSTERDTVTSGSNQATATLDAEALAGTNVLVLIVAGMVGGDPSDIPPRELDTTPPAGWSTLVLLENISMGTSLDLFLTFGIWYQYTSGTIGPDVIEWESDDPSHSSVGGAYRWPIEYPTTSALGQASWGGD
jgi:hypothetical protein